MDAATADPSVGWIARRLLSLVPADTRAAAAAIGPATGLGAEAALVAGAVPARRHEFLTGRTLARTALAALGGPPRPIPADADRVPVWPPGFVGSISHGGGLCAAQVARATDLRGLGIDLEPAGSVPDDLTASIVAPDEWTALAAGAPDAATARTLAFSAKEAAYKAAFPVTRRLLGFQDVRLAVDWPGARFTAALPDGARIDGRFHATAVLLAAAWLPA